MTSGYPIGAARGLEPAAAAIFAGACAFAAAELWPTGGSTWLVAAAVSYILAYGLSVSILLRVASGDARFPMRGFDVAPLVASDELLLDDALEPAGPDSRVVRLFAAGHAPLRSRATPDETDALLRALSELRRSFH